MEIQILHWFESLHNPITNPIMYGITSLGNGGIFWIILAAAMLLIFPKKYRKVGLIELILCNLILKNVVARIRPYEVKQTIELLIAKPIDYSFPSGHSSASFAAATAIFMWRKKEGTAALILAALIAVSRLYLTVHYPSDVLVGTITGILYGIASYFIAQQLMKRIPKFNEIFNK